MQAIRLLKLSLSVQRRAPGAPDDMGDPGATNSGAPVVYKGWIWQDASSEDTGNQALENEQFRFAMERRAAGLIDAGDTVTHDGTTYEVDGPPWTAINPRTRAVEYVYGTLRRST
jgi:hypothetical protein